MPRTSATRRIMPRFMGGSVSLNGTTSTIPTTLTSNDVFKTGNGFTMWRWVKVRSLGGGSLGNIFDKSTSAPGVNGFVYRLSGQVLNFCVNGNPTTSSASNSVTFNRWQLALVTVAPNATVTHYINGIASGTPGAVNALAGITTANPLTIGNRSTATDRTFDGLMGEGGICPRVLTQAEITALYTTGALPTGTAHHWTLDEVTGVFADSIGGATGTGTDTAYSTDTPVQARKAVGNDRASLSFDGVDDVLTCPVLSPEYITLDVVYYARDGEAGDLINKYFSTNFRSFALSIVNSSIAFFTSSTGDSVGQSFFSSPILPVYNRWNRVVATYDGVLMKMYFNGQLVAQQAQTGTIFASNQNIKIGPYTGTRNGGYTGLIKSARIWNTALTASQVRDLHFSNIVPRTNLVGEWLLNEGAGTTATDTSGNGNTGTISGATWSADVPNAPRQLIGGNLVKNGDFSYVPVVNVPTVASKWIDGTAGGRDDGHIADNLFGWRIICNVTSQETGFDTAVLFNGKPTIKQKVITKGAGSYVLIDHTPNYVSTGSPTSKYSIRVKPNTEYIASMYVKTENVGATNGARLRVYTKSGSSTVATITSTAGLAVGTQDFVKLEITFTTGATVSWVRLIAITAEGVDIVDGSTAWFADIRLTPTTPEARTAQ